MTHFTYLLRVRYSECDAQKVVFNAKYAEYLDIAATEYTRMIWGDYDDIVASGIENQVVNMTLSWSSPAKFDDVLAIEVHNSKQGNSSYTLSFSLKNHATGALIATGEIVYVMVDAKHFTTLSIPENLRATLEKGAPSVVVNHAGVSTVEN